MAHSRQRRRGWSRLIGTVLKSFNLHSSLSNQICHDVECPPLNRVCMCQLLRGSSPGKFEPIMIEASKCAADCRSFLVVNFFLLSLIKSFAKLSSMHPPSANIMRTCQSGLATSSLEEAKSSETCLRFMYSLCLLSPARCESSLVLFGKLAATL